MKTEDVMRTSSRLETKPTMKSSLRTAALLALGLTLSAQAQAGSATSRISGNSQVGIGNTLPVTTQPTPRLIPIEQSGGVTSAPDLPLSAICSPGILDRVITAGPSPSRQHMLALVHAMQDRLCPGGGRGRRSSNQLEADPGSDNSQQ
jgi:hypothetical protein